MQAYFTLIYSLSMSILRRIFGTQFYIGKVKIPRLVKNIVYVLLLLLMYYTSGNFPTTITAWLMCIWVIGWAVRYWNHSHSAYWILYNEEPDCGKYKWIEKLLTWLFGKGKYYNFAGNFIGLTCGYFVPALLASIFMPHHWFWIAGFTTPIGYALCEYALGKDSNTEYAEFLNGFTMGLIFYVNL